jgi:hypothetical protein
VRRKAYGVRDIPEASIERKFDEAKKVGRRSALIDDEAAWSGYGAGAAEAALPSKWGWR